MFEEGLDSIDFLCPECSMCTTLTRISSAEFDLSDMIGVDIVDTNPYEDNSPETVAKNRYLNQIWLGSLPKNIALLKLVEPDNKNLVDEENKGDDAGG